jgi:cellulose synthase/poly-beta-1,6-N-acetylglucosamine synthase-like glycosyltransferase
MMNKAEVLFALSMGLVVYTYLGFPLLVFLRARFRRVPYDCGEITPIVTVVIVAHNEVTGIRRKIENLLALDYPRDHLEVIVASDGSDDGTNQVVMEYRSRGIRLLPLPRRGKIPNLNAAVRKARGQILVFSDANSMYRPDALRILIRPFKDPGVGGVAGNQSYVSDARSSVSAGERTYWSFDQALKHWQSEAGSVTSATGAIYAVRSELFEPVPSGVSDDAMISYRVVARGYRMVYEPRAIAYETVSPDARAEFRRKIRVCARGLRAIAEFPRLLDPFRYGFFAVQLFSHKLLRWLMVWPLLAMILVSVGLAAQSTFFKVATVGQSLFYGLALAIFLIRSGTLARSRIFRMITLPFYFCLANVACLIAQWWFISGRRIDSWEIRRVENF